jgi:hypothetical protein
MRGLDSKPSNRETASDFTWTLGSRTGLQLPLNNGGDRFASRSPAARFGNGSH